MTRSLYGSRAAPDTQREWFRTGDVPVTVYGLGKMGLPLAAVYAENTGNVTGVDVDESVVKAINSGECPVEREPGLPELVRDLVERGALGATTDGPAAAEQASVHVVIVPTLIDEDNDPDLSAVTAVAMDVASGLSPGDLVILESTLPPRACEDVVEPLLADRSGLDRDEFGVAFCPERTSSGRALEDIRGAYPKVVGGVDDESTRAAQLAYDVLVDNDVLAVSDATTAEAVKVFEGLYRDANIALANDLARLTDELQIDVREAIDAANTQPFCDIHTPGPGVGGHCIPFYPYFVLHWLRADPPLVRTAREVNDAMPEFVVDRVEEGVTVQHSRPHATDGGARRSPGPPEDGSRRPNGGPPEDDGRRTDGGMRTDEPSGSRRSPSNGSDHSADDETERTTDRGVAVSNSRVAVLGLTYRAGVRETRASPGIDICEALDDRGATVYAADPLVDAADAPAEHVALHELADLDLDAVVLATEHEEFQTIDWDDFDPLVVVDGRDALDLSGTDHRQYVVGRGWV